MKKRKLLLLLISFSLLAFLNFYCRNDVTGPANGGLSLTLSDVSCTEAWLNLTAGNSSLPVNITIKKNNNNFLIFTLSHSDTTIYDSTLSPNKTYTYQAVLNNETSSKISATTLDTTSNNFTWQTYTFGGNAGSCTLNACAIFNDTLAYAVGKVYLEDSTGKPDQLPYNLSIWDGKYWQLKRISVNYNGNLVTPPLEGLFPFLPNSIWVVGSFPIYGNGKTWILYQLQQMGLSVSVSRAWGANFSNMYFVGVQGSIAQYSNGSWQKIESGTNLDIQDIWGITNSNSNQEEIYCIASNLFTADGNAVLQINGNQVKEASNKGLPIYYFSSIWFNNENLAYIVGSGIYINHNFSNGGAWKELQPRVSDDYLNSVRGNDVNDIVAVGSYGEVLHFNGVRWRSYINETGLPDGEYLSVAIKGNEIIAVGYNGAKAVILMGRR